MILKPKYNDEIIELNLDDPEVLEKVTALVQKGMYYDKKGKAELDDLRSKVPELNKYKEYVENFTARINRAKTDPAEFKAFVADIEKELGRKLTATEKAEAASDLFGEDEAVQALKREVEELKSALNDTKVDMLGRDIKNIHAQLGKKYTGEDGMPKYDAEQVQRYIDEKGLYSHDLQGLYEDVYIAMNKDKVYESIKSKSLQGRRDGLIDRTGADTNVSVTPKIETKGKSINELKNAILERLEKTGESLVEPE